MVSTKTSLLHWNGVIQHSLCFQLHGFFSIAAESMNIFRILLKYLHSCELEFLLSAKFKMSLSPCLVSAKILKSRVDIIVDLL